MNKELSALWTSENIDCLSKAIKESSDSKLSQLGTPYAGLLKLLIENVLNKGKKQFDADKIHVVDYGQYQGTLIFIFPEDVYQPNMMETYYTSVEYGSCSGCDTYLSITRYDNKFNDDQVKDLVTLCLHLLEGIHAFREIYKDF